MRNLYLLATCLILFIISGCKTQSDAKQPQSEQNQKTVEESTHLSLLNSKDDNSASSPLSQSMTNLACNYLEYTRNKAPHENIVFSPYSIYTAIAAITNGAAGDTKSEMEKYLGSGIKNINNFYRDINKNYQEVEEITIKSANKLFLNKLKIEKPFNDVLKSYYNSDALELDFKKSESVKIINDWVYDNTKGLIDSIISELSDAEKLVAVNTLYLKADWNSPFTAIAQKQEFTNSKNKKMLTEFVSGDKNLAYLKTDNYTAVSIPYKNKRFEMLLIDPADDFVLKSETPIYFKNNSETEYIRIKFPKMDIEYKDESFKQYLQESGLKLPFYGKADFSGITKEHSLYISDIIHKARLKADETGTEAAAATAIVMKVLSVPSKPQIEVSFNKPFLFIIWDNKDNIPLFTGRYNTP